MIFKEVYDDRGRFCELRAVLSARAGCEYVMKQTYFSKRYELAHPGINGVGLPMGLDKLLEGVI